MERLDIKDYQDILNILDIANSREDIDTFRRDLLDSLSTIFQADSAMFLLSDAGLAEVDGSDCISINISREIWQEFPFHRAMDPFYRHGGLQGSVVSIGDLMPYATWERDPFYNGFCRPLGIYHKLVIYLRREKEIFGVIGMCRNRDNADFTERNKLACQILATPLTTALAYVTIVSRYMQRHGSWNPGKEASPSTGVMLLDYNLNLVDIDRNAEQYCYVLGKDYPVLRHDGILLPDDILDVCLELRKIVATKKPGAKRRMNKVLATQTGQYIHLETSVIWKSFNAVSVPFFMVALTDLPGPVITPDMNEYNLTRREIEIAQCICQGLSNKDIGDLLYISENTVETHLKNLFRKTGIKNRASLYTLMENHGKKEHHLPVKNPLL